MPSGLQQKILGLCIPPILFGGLDATLTLVGQPPQYWAGHREFVNEMSPILHKLLTIHPAVFVGCVGLAEMLYVALILLSPDAMALMLSVAGVISGIFGASSWLLHRYRMGYQATEALILLGAIAIGVGVRWGWRAIPSEPQPFSQMPSALRWGLIAALFCACCFVMFWPGAFSL